MVREKRTKFNFDFKVPRHKRNPFDPEQRELDYEFKLRMEKLSRKVGERHEKDPNSGVVFLKNFPHAFAEHPMRKFFSQFGRIKRLRISRSRKTGKSRGFAYIEFEYEEVAKIVAETMNNYLMFRQIMKCELVPKEKLHPETFKGCFQKSFKPLSRAFDIKKTNKYIEATPTKVCEQLKKKARKEQKKQKLLAEMGIDYNITGHYSDEYADVKAKLEKMQQAIRLPKETARAKVLENTKKGAEESDDSENEDLKSDDSEEDDLKSDDDSEMKTGEESMEENMSPRKGNKRKLEMDRNEAIDKAKKIQKEIQIKAQSESKKQDKNEIVDKARKVEKEMQAKAQSESEEDAESSSDESDVSTEEEDQSPAAEPTKTKPKTPEEADKKRLVTPGSKKQRLTQESGSVGKKQGSKGHPGADKVTPFKGGRSIVKGTPKSVGKKPVPRKSIKRDNMTPPKGQRPTMEQTSKSTGKKYTGSSKLDTDLVTPTKETGSPRQQLSKSTGKKSAPKNRFEKEVLTPASERPMKQTSKSTGKKGTVKRTKMETTTPGKGQRLASQKKAKSTGKKDLSKRRVPMST